MRIPRAYEEQPLAADIEIELSDQVHNHLVKVLRMSAGQQICLFNGDGYDYQAELTTVEKRRSQVRVQTAELSQTESPLKMIVGQGISRGERMDWAIQKSTEIGISQITPLFTERSEVRLNAERQQKRARHWRQVAISACEQSYRSTLPIIDEPAYLAEWVLSVEADLKLVLHPHTTPLVLGELDCPKSIALLIGPEGGLDDSEVEKALAANFKPWLLGPRVLRTETAPVAAAAVLNYLWGDFN